jgi:two-component system alkaline phosphatase synthesis response regulator PhoP
LKKVLIVDDEAHILELLEFNLKKNGYEVVKAENGLMAIDLAKESKPDIILLDLMLPDLDGIEVCRRLKRERDTSAIPIIMLTAKSDEIDKIIGLEMGADDYVTKPFSVRELIARIKTVSRRVDKSLNNDDSRDRISIKDVTVDVEKFEAYKEDKKVDLTLKEFQLLELLIRNAGKVLKRDYLLEVIWGYQYMGETRTVDVHIRNLRKKLDDSDKEPKYIETIRGIGYKFIKE